MAKRLFDVLGALVALLLLLPLLIAVAIAIKRDSPGPVFFRQLRVGREGRLFWIHKFRTMVADAANRGPQVTAAYDPRITRVGQWLRRSKLDELPQLIDVLAGHMSLVGPRPEVPRYVAMYPADLRVKVLSVRPGITDPVSLDYADEGDLLANAADAELEYVQVVMPAKLRASAAYAESATLWSDLRVIARTLCTLVAR